MLPGLSMPFIIGAKGGAIEWEVVEMKRAADARSFGTAFRRGDLLVGGFSVGFAGSAPVMTLSQGVLKSYEEIIAQPSSTGRSFGYMFHKLLDGSESGNFISRDGNSAPGNGLVRGILRPSRPVSEIEVFTHEAVQSVQNRTAFDYSWEPPVELPFPLPFFAMVDQSSNSQWSGPYGFTVTPGPFEQIPVENFNYRRNAMGALEGGATQRFRSDAGSTNTATVRKRLFFQYFKVT